VQGFQGRQTFVFLLRYLGRAVIVAAVQCQAIVMGCGCRIYTHIHALRNGYRCAYTQTPCTLLRSTSPHHRLSCGLSLLLLLFDAKPLSSVADAGPILWCLGWRCNRLPPQFSSSPHSHRLQQIFPPLSIQLVHLSPGDKWQQCGGPRQSNLFTPDGWRMASLCTAASWCAATS
jgi:hypothetical protein